MKPLYIILTFCIGLFAGYLLFSDTDAPIAHPVIPSLTEQKAKAIDTSKSQAERILKKQNTLLSGQLLIINTQLKESKSSLANERQKVARLKQGLVQDTSTCPDKVMLDSLSQCIDTLNAATDTLIARYEQKLNLNTEIIALRDSEIVVCNTSYQQVKGLIKEQALREQQLTDQLNTAIKQQRKKRFQNRFLAAGMLFLSGLTTTLIIKTKQ